MAKKVSKSYHKNVNAKDVRIWRKWQKRTKVFALVGLLIALGAGGYWAYKSFAATASFAYTVGNGTLKAGANSAVLIEPGNKGKAGEQVIVMQPGGKAIVDSAKNGQIGIPAGQAFELCADAKVGHNGLAFFRANIGTPYGYRDAWYGTPGGLTPLSNGYTEYCTASRYTEVKLTGPVSLTNDDPDPMYISAFVIKFVNE